MITVSMSTAEFRALQQIAQTRTDYFDGMEPEKLLRCFIGDLTDSVYSGGSDERMYAWQWIERRFGPRERVSAAQYEPVSVRYPFLNKQPAEISDYFDRALGLVSDDEKGGQK